MYELKLHDPRRSKTWLEELRPTDFVGFTKDAVSGATLDVEGRPLGDPLDASCLVFDRFAEAEAFATAAVERIPRLQIDVYDARGRTEPPLLTALHASQESRRPTNPRAMRIRKAASAVLLTASLPLLVYDLGLHDARLIFPTFFAIQMIVVAIRMLSMNYVLRGAERTRLERVAKLRGGSAASV